MIENHVTQIAKEVLKTWLGICAFGERTVGTNETIETDSGSSLPRFYGQENANRVLEALRGKLVKFGWVRDSNIWLARSKLRVGSCGLSEGSSHMVSKVGGTALGWFHRAATTPRSRQLGREAYSGNEFRNISFLIDRTRSSRFE
ncbi:red chlorophyll catabolite reductase, chloroplastic, partial [Tanacetum coccineum]